MRISCRAAWFGIARLFLFACLMDGCRSLTPKPAANAADRIADVRLVRFDVLPPYVLQQLQDRMSSKAGTPFSDALEQAVGTLAVETLQNHGHPYAQAQIAREPAGTGLVRLVVTAIPGTVGFFGRTEISGNVHVDDAIIRSRLAYRPGELFRRSALEQSQEQLAALNLFKTVRIEAVNIDTQPADVPIQVTVVERNPWRWNLGLGYANKEHLGLEASVANMNFFGGARRFELGGRITTIDHLLEASLTQPQLWGHNVTLTLTARDWWVVNDLAFRTVSTGGQAAFTWIPNLQSSVTFAYAASRERSLLSPGFVDQATGLQNGLLSAWSVNFNRRALTTMSTTAPSGRAWSLYMEQAGGWMPGEFNYYYAIGDMRAYHTNANGRLTLAGFGRYGSVSPMHQESDIPVLKRLFLGGPDQMRGWSRFEVGPLSPLGEPIGGKSLLAGTVELRAQLQRRVRGAVFVEGGNVWRGDWTAHLGDLQFDAGPGLRVQSPFGLVRVDVGFQLNTIPGLRIDGQPQLHRWRLNVGIGEAF
jgi:translocation and assembly module TamA